MPRCGHVPGSTGSNAYNTGMMILRNRPATLAIMREWHLRLASPNECAAASEPEPEAPSLTLALYVISYPILALPWGQYPDAARYARMTNALMGVTRCKSCPSQIISMQRRRLNCSSM